ncbi:hypothetical protein, partial [Enterobacter cloacae complex sp. IR5422]
GQNQPRRDDFGLKIGKLSHRTSIKDGLGRHIGSCGPLNRNFLSMVSIFLTGIVLYACGEVFFLAYKGIPMSFSSDIVLFLGKISICIGIFAGVMLWIANLLKK